jgi:hypothetical protein
MCSNTSAPKTKRMLRTCPAEWIGKIRVGDVRVLVKTRLADPAAGPSTNLAIHLTATSSSIRSLHNNYTETRGIEHHNAFLINKSATA